ncbi:LysR family transcriptional regulator [Microvirga arsenatis]|uniref:LysR family transcriptional regulator n=1 Tax=Microvirga arsenatis TaxID=2692265 RepID=A0ABW9YW10_9HYPH|nr:LysR family transcriptional regulator [Microvirga arsenatis]NBJ10519.1 LysR family transcriptional regulator [Microvirga arsenatis]NBJ24582.1 LysR family transcriptional regulator [Microvirga arsenatis]
MDWDKIRLFYEVVSAGNFTRAGEKLGVNQSSVSRQISALEHDLKVPLFHRHPRGLVLTEHGDVLYRAAQDIRLRLEETRQRLTETSERPAGDLRVTATVGIGGIWLARRITEFLDLYPDVRIQLILTNDELDLAMRQADIAIRLRRPAQPDLIQRRLFTVQYHAYAAHAYIERFGEPETITDLDRHAIVCLGGDQPAFILDLHSLTHLGRDPKDPRASRLVVNDSLALRQAIENGAGIGMAPDYAMSTNPRVKQVLRDVEMPSLDSYLVYPEEMRSVARVQVFRDFLVSKAQRWDF